MKTPDEPRATTAEPAHPGWRLLALGYDLLPVLALLMIGSAIFLWLNGGRTVETDPWLGAVQFVALWALVGGYFVASWRRGGQTIGMRPWRLRVVAERGGAAAAGKLWLRYLVACVTPGIGLLWALADGRRRGLYDVVAGTKVVREARGKRDRA